MDQNTSLARSALRTTTVALLAVAIVGASGCGWLRGRSAYDQSPESRPLEVPPDLDMPRIDPAMNIPGTPAAATARAPAAAGSSGPFTVADASDSAWRRVGLALDRIEGVTIIDRAQLLSAYNVRYQGEELLIRVSADGSNSQVSAVGADGAAATSAAAGRLLGLLRARLS
jgi:uncharacterized lipoprotein